MLLSDIRVQLGAWQQRVGRIAATTQVRSLPAASWLKHLHSTEASMKGSLTQTSIGRTKKPPETW